ncbi:hypothetical protein Tco_0017821 [Tanacetum coccineum]
MMTCLKHVGNKKHSNLKNKTFEDIQAIYKEVKRFDESFTAVGSTEDERRIKEMNEGVKDTDQKSLKKRVDKETSKKEDTAKVPSNVDITEQGIKKRKGGHIKMLARKRKRLQSDVDSDDEHRKCLNIVTFEGIMDSEIMERKSIIARLNKVSSLDGDYLVIYRANGNFRAFNCLLEVLHIFDRQDLFHLYDLVMEQYSEITLEGIELILWGDLKIMMESSQEENDQSDFWDDQQDWEIVTWRLYEACGVYILELKDGTVIHMLVERRYPLSKDLLQRMLRTAPWVQDNDKIGLKREKVVSLYDGLFGGGVSMTKEGFLQNKELLPSENHDPSSRTQLRKLGLYEKVKRFDESFTVIGSTEDERKIKEMNEGASDPEKKKKFVKEDVLNLRLPVKQGITHPEWRHFLFLQKPMGTSRHFNYLLEKGKNDHMTSGTINKIGRLLDGDYMKLVEMLEFGLEVEVDSTAALDLIRFIKQQLNEE